MPETRWPDIREAALAAGYPGELPHVCDEVALSDALDWLAVVAAVRSMRVHDFGPADPHGRCRRPGCGVPFLDAGDSCPGPAHASRPGR